MQVFRPEAVFTIVLIIYKVTVVPNGHIKSFVCVNNLLMLYEWREPVDVITYRDGRMLFDYLADKHNVSYYSLNIYI